MRVRPRNYNPCTFYYKQLDLRTLVHGDDFVTSGQSEGCDWFKKQLETRYSIKTKILGMREDEVKEERVPNRVIRVTAQGWEMEADQRHVDIMIEQLNLKEAEGVSSPGEEEKRWEEEDNRQSLEGTEARHYRELAARANHLAQDRIDIQYATKEICRSMFHPRPGRC